VLVLGRGRGAVRALAVVEGLGLLAAAHSTGKVQLQVRRGLRGSGPLAGATGLKSLWVWLVCLPHPARPPTM
jgi:hypothetical protein